MITHAQIQHPTAPPGRDGGKDGDNAKYLFDNKFNIPADHEYRVTIYSDQSVCVTYINDQLSFTNRIYQMQKNPWALCCYKGEITVSDIQVSTY